MKLGKDNPDENGHLEAPGKLVAGLRALFETDVPVPPEIDRRILATGRERFARPRSRLLVLRWSTVAAAAVCLLVAFLVSMQGKRTTPTPPALVGLAAKEDFDRNGQVDILDAFALARRIKASDEYKGEWDINRDGLVNQKDVDMIAMAAVSLKRRTFQ